MVNAISAVGSYYSIARYPRIQSLSMNQAEQTPKTRLSGSLTLRKRADLETPVEPVRPVLSINPDAASPIQTAASRWSENYAAEQAVRMRIQYMDPSVAGTKSAQKTAEDGRCETCEKRKYQDGSDDPSVSFQMPTRIDPDTAAATVRGHEMEHVFHEQARAEQNDRKVVSQSVMLHTGICPECGRVYISGGTTHTVTKADSGDENLTPEASPEAKA